MKRVLLMLAATAAFACTGAMAQAGGGAGGGTAGGGTASGSATMGAKGNVSPGGQEASTTQTNTGRHHKKNGAMGEEANEGKSGKKSTLTGCISASPNSDGMYTLSNGRYKNGVEIGPSDKVKDHAGHQVALKGTWSTAAAAGENAGVASSTGTSEKGEKHFDVSSVKHISDTCKEAPGGGTMGHKAHNKKKSGSTGDNGGTSSTPPPSR